MQESLWEAFVSAFGAFHEGSREAEALNVILGTVGAFTAGAVTT